MSWLVTSVMLVSDTAKVGYGFVLLICATIWMWGIYLLYYCFIPGLLVRAIGWSRPGIYAGWSGQAFQTVIALCAFFGWLWISQLTGMDAIPAAVMNWGFKLVQRVAS